MGGNGGKTGSLETGTDQDRGRDGAEGNLVTLEAAELEADPPTVLAPSSGWSGVGSHDINPRVLTVNKNQGGGAGCNWTPTAHLAIDTTS